MRSADTGSNVPGGHALPQRLTHINSHNALASGHRTLEELLTALRKGADLLKHGRLGKPKMHFFRLAEADTHLMWRSSNGKQRSITLASVFQVVPGQTSENFRRHPLPNLARASFSLLYTDTDQSVRTLDLTCRSQQEFELWYRGLHAVMEREAALSPSGGAKPAAAFTLMASAAQPVLKEARSMSGPLKAPELTPLPSTKHAIGGGTVQGRITGAMGVPVPEHRPGDCYVWGSCEPKSNGSANPSPVCSSAVTCNPILVSDSSHLDVCEASVGRQHAVLVTRGGELFTWGSGHGGKLGLGHMMDSLSPQRVHTLWGQSIKHVAAGDYCTAAVSEEGSLFTWGDGAAQNLGYADVLRQVIPRRVDFGSVQQVLQVSCGPYHSAAVVSSGALFTWGDGLCGKLGHGDQQSICGPRQVEGLAGCRVLHVACGVWHTAAVAAHVPGVESLQQQGSAEVDPAEWEAIQQKMADAYDALDEEGGQLYTWGGAFEDSATKSVPLTPRLPAQKDNHQGCLGHGDKAGRLTPTRVAGALECLGVRQVECGLNLTVALTVDGRVWQMGETGAASDKQALWERALVPVQVPLPGCYVGRIAVGMQHAAALTELLEAQSPVSQVGEQACTIFTWGRGREGQLGTGVYADSAFPQPVGDLQGRQVLQIACGGYHTLAVCRHDAEREDTEERRRGYKGKMRVWFANTNASLDLAATRSASEPYGSGKTPTSASSQQTDDSSPSAYDSSSPSAGAAEVRSTGRFPPRKSVLKRGSFMGLRAPLALTNATNLIRRHSGDAYASSHKLLSGLRMPSPSGSETSRREAFSEGHGDSEAPLKVERRAAGTEEGDLLHGAVPLKSRPNPERRLREQQFAQEAQTTQLQHQVADAGSASKAPNQRHLEQDLHAGVENAGATEQSGAVKPLSRYLSTSQQVASALAANRAQLPDMGSPALPKHPGQGPEQEQCIQELRDKVAYLERLVAEGGATHTQPATLHTGFPAVPSPSPHKNLALISPVTPADAGRAPGGMRDGCVSNQSPPPRRVLSLSPERPPLSAASPGHRSSASRALTLDGVSAGPLWQVDAPIQYASAEPAQQHAARPSAAAQRPAAEQALSSEAQHTPEGSCSSSSTNFGSPATSARQPEPVAATPLGSTLSERAPASLVADAEDPKSAEAAEEASSGPRAPAQRSDTEATPCSKTPADEFHESSLSYGRLPEPAVTPESSRLAENAAANPYSHGYPSAGPVRSPLRMNTIDVGALMGHRSGRSTQQDSMQMRPGSGRPVSLPPSGSPCRSIGTENSAAGEMAAAADDTEAERMELLALRRQLRERERRLHEREQHLQSKEAVIQATCTRIMFPGQPLPRRGAAQRLGAAAQTKNATQRSRGADSCPPQQPAPAARNSGQLPTAAAQGVTASVARERVELPMPTSSPQAQPPVQLPDQGIPILPSSGSASSCDGAHGEVGQLTAMPEKAQPEEQRPHSSVDTVSLARPAHSITELCDHMTAPQQQNADPDTSRVDNADTTQAAEVLQELEPHHSDTESVHLSGSVEKQKGVQAHPIDGSANLVRSDSASSGSSFYNPTASEPGSEDSNGKIKKSFSFCKPSPSQGPLKPLGAASQPDSDQTEMLQGQGAPGKEADSAAACAEHTLPSPLFGVAAASPAGGEAAPQNTGASSAAAGSVMY